MAYALNQDAPMAYLPRWTTTTREYYQGVAVMVRSAIREAPRGNYMVHLRSTEVARLPKSSWCRSQTVSSVCKMPKANYEMLLSLIYFANQETHITYSAIFYNAKCYYFN